MIAPSASTVYQQVNKTLRERIRSGEFAAGAKFLTEREIASKYRVSRPTANKILTSMVSEGLLQFRKGVGTFVSSGVLDYDMRRLVSFTDKARAAGRKPATKVLKFQRLKGNDCPEIATQLRCDDHDEIYYFERLRTADKEPVILERRHVPARLCPNLRAKDLEVSLYGLWTRRYGLEISQAEQFIQAVNLDSTDAKLLRVSQRTAALRVIGRGFLTTGKPLWYEQTTYRSDAYEFHTILGGISAWRPAVGQFSEPRKS